jgi:acetolactate synthase-1/2/3 large subunit
MSKLKEGASKRQPQYGSDLIVDLMTSLGIEYVAFNPGATFRGIHESIVNYAGNANPQIIFCHHEEISAAIAHGYAKAKGKPMAVIAHDIVGLQHASMAIFNAWCDRVPMIVLGGTGPMDSTMRRPRIDWLHTALVQGNQVRDYVKWDDQPHNLASVPASLIRGYRLAVTEPQAPIYICYDITLQEERIQTPITLPDLSRFSPPAPMAANREALQKAADLLCHAKAPLIVTDLTGRHPDAVKSLVELAELLSAPVIDRGGRFNIPNTHPLDVTGGAEPFLKEADVILALDVQDLCGVFRKADRRTRKALEYVISPATQIIHISMNDMLIHSWCTEYQELEVIDVPISAVTAVALPELTKLCRQGLRTTEKTNPARTKRFKTIKACHEQLRGKWLAEAQAAASSREIATSFLALEIWETIKNEDWVLVHGGPQGGGWTRQIWNWTKPYQYLGGNGGGGLGYGMGASIGATLAHKGTGKICVNFQSDGDLLMTPSAFWTAAHHQIPLLTVVFNNQSYFNSEAHQSHLAKFRGRPTETAGIGTHVENPAVDFAKIAQGFGMYAEGPIRKSADLRPALLRALKVVKEKNLPALVDVVAGVI